jgi:predicted Zn-dependent protease
MRSQDVVEAALAKSQADRAVVIAHEGSTANLRWASNSLTSNGDMRSREVTMVSIYDHAAGARVGVVTRDVAHAHEVDALVAAADAVARGSDSSPDANELAAGPDSPDWEAPVPQTSAAVFSDFAAQLAEVCSEADGSGQELWGYAEHELVTTFVGTSRGRRLRHDQPDGKIELTGKADHRTRSAWVGQHVPDFGQADAAAMASEIAQRLAWQAVQVPVAAGRHDVVLSPSAVSDLYVYVYWTASARDAAEGRTVFADPGGGTRVGERLTDVPLTLSSDPAAPGREAAPFVVAEASTSVTSVFDNGLPLSPTRWIADGVLEHLLQTRHSAALTNLTATPYIDNLALSVDGGHGSTMDVVSGMDRGLLVNTLWYIREVDPQNLLLTGLTRDGVYVVEGGEVVGATTNFRFNESPIELLSRISAAGASGSTLPREWNDDFTRTAAPALRFDGFNMSTVSQAS